MLTDFDVYYKLYRMTNEKITVCCLQWFDEYNYLSRRFIKNDYDIDYTFFDKEDAIVFLNDNFDKFIIDDEYLRDCPIKLYIDEKEYSCINKEQVINFLENYGRK